VTADEIRACNQRFTKRFMKELPQVQGVEHVAIFALANLTNAAWEIAAQLAEQNAIARESIDMRKADDADMKAYREQALRTASETKDLIQAPTRGPIVIPTGPQDTNEPQHLGCFLLLPDGSHGIAVAPGIIIQMDPEDARRIIAAISKPPEGKPS
jgi:hypothetical protein